MAAICFAIGLRRLRYCGSSRSSSKSRFGILVQKILESTRQNTVQIKKRPAPPPPRGPAPSQSPSLQETEERRVREHLRCAQDFTCAKLYANYGYKFQGLFHALMVQLSSAGNKVVVHGVQSGELPWETKAVPRKSKTAPTKNNLYSPVFTKWESSLEVALDKPQSIISPLISLLPSTPFRAKKKVRQLRTKRSHDAVQVKKPTLMGHKRSSGNKERSAE